MNSFAHTACCAAAGVMMLIAPQSGRAQTPDPAKPFIESISYGGSGCPLGSMGKSIANDRLSFTLIFDTMVASSGPSVPATESRKNCQISLNLSVSAGLSVWVQTASARGYVSLPAGQNASLTSATTFSKPNGDPEAGNDNSGVLRRSLQTDFVGPVSRDYLVVDGHNYVTHADCGGEATSTRTMVLDFGLAAGDAGAPTQITMDSLDGTLLVQKVNACKGNKGGQ